MLDVLEALGPHLRSIIVIGAHAIYLREPSTSVALAPFTRDSDLAIDPRELADAPKLEEAMRRAGFTQDADGAQTQPGIWLRRVGEELDEVDLMVPEAFAGAGGRRTVRLPPHDYRAARRAHGLEGVLVDNDLMPVRALAPEDERTFHVRVAGPAAMLVSKLFKLYERIGSAERMFDKDAHDLFRILTGTEPEDLQRRYRRLLADEVSRGVAVAALGYLNELFAAGPDAVGSMMAGRAEAGVGEPETVARQVSILAEEILEMLRDVTTGS